MTSSWYKTWTWSSLRFGMSWLSAGTILTMMLNVFAAKRRHFITWRHNERDGISNQQPHDCLLNYLFRRRSKKTSKFRVTGLCEGNSPVTGEFPAQRANSAENVSIWWRHHVRFSEWVVDEAETIRSQSFSLNIILVNVKSAHSDNDR